MATINVSDLRKELEKVPDDHLVVFEHEDEPKATYSVDEIQNANGFFVLRCVPSRKEG